MKNAKTIENRIIHKPELTAFVREVVLPGSSGVVPKLDARFCRFKLKVQRSPIHRWGIFAAEQIPARRRVIEYTGQKIDAREVWRRRFRQHLYLFRLNQNRAIDGAIGGSGAEFINHSCNPNLYARVGGGRIFFVSHRVIALAEELTLDYNIVNEGVDLACTCGAEKCRGIINRND
jgi:uncharacterized protein